MLIIPAVGTAGWGFLEQKLFLEGLEVSGEINKYLKRLRDLEPAACFVADSDPDRQVDIDISYWDTEENQACEIKFTEHEHDFDFESQIINTFKQAIEVVEEKKKADGTYFPWINEVGLAQ